MMRLYQVFDGRRELGVVWHLDLARATLEAHQRWPHRTVTVRPARYVGGQLDRAA